MRISGLIRFLKDNSLMIAVTAAVIFLWNYLIPPDVESVLSNYCVPIVFGGFAVMMCILFLPSGIKMLRQAKNGDISVGPLTPGKIIDTLPVLDEDTEETGLQYVVSFVNQKYLRSLGYTQIFYGEPKYHKGDTVNLWDITKQPKGSGAPRDSRPTYDVDIWDEQSAADERKVTRVCGWILVGFTAFWVLAALVAVCLSFLYFVR